MKYRIEQDAVGQMKLPAKALYGINALRAKRNFPVTNEPVQPMLIKSLIMIKKAAAITNNQAGTLSDEKCKLIKKACDELLEGKHSSAFIVPSIQGGAGTSTNMNVNEVIAHLAIQLSGNKVTVYSHDDVNRCQSTNDTYPSSGKIAMLLLLPALIKQVKKLIKSFHDKAKEYKGAIKVGRTQLQDAVPTTFENSFNAYASMFRRDVKRLAGTEDALSHLNLGGTAIGTGITTSKYYRDHIIENLCSVTGLPLKRADNLIDATQNCDGFVEFSSALKALAVDLSKMCNDLRLLGSGPQAGLDELYLPKAQPGSSIMPDKINPVVPEVVNQTAFEVIGYDTTVTLCAEAGQLELNAFEPIMFRELIVGEKHLTNAIATLIKHCITGIKVNTKLTRSEVENSAIAATILVPRLGYAHATNLIKEALAKKVSVKKLTAKKHLMSRQEINKLFSTKRLVNS